MCTTSSSAVTTQMKTQGQVWRRCWDGLSHLTRTFSKFSCGPKSHFYLCNYVCVQAGQKKDSCHKFLIQLFIPLSKSHSKYIEFIRSQRGSNALSFCYPELNVKRRKKNKHGNWLLQDSSWFYLEEAIFHLNIITI